MLRSRAARRSPAPDGQGGADRSRRPRHRRPRAGRRAPPERLRDPTLRLDRGRRAATDERKVRRCGGESTDARAPVIGTLRSDGGRDRDQPVDKRYGAARGIEDVSRRCDRARSSDSSAHGAGKTTTIRTLLDLLHPMSGARGCSAWTAIASAPASMPPRELRRGVRCRSPLERPGGRRLRCRTAWHAHAGTCHGARGALRGRHGRPGRGASRGNRQKIGLVQAAFDDPELLGARQPTGGLDPLMQERSSTSCRRSAPAATPCPLR